MKFKIKGSKEAVLKLVKRYFFLAYQASDCYGMGILKAVDAATEDAVFNNVLTNGDYIGGPTNKPNRPYGDYVFGRMMKVGCEFTDDEIKVPDMEPRRDYQAWANEYPSYEALLQAAAKELDIEIEPID